MDPMRPRFELVVPLREEEVLARLEAQQSCSGCPCQARVLGSTVDVQIVERLRHVWSPHLSFQISEVPEGSQLHGLFGPNPNVWTAVAAACAFSIFSAIFGGTLGLVQLGLGRPAWGLWSLPAAALGLVIPYLISQLGQRRAAEQMEMLRCFLRAVLGLETPAAPPSKECPEPQPRPGRPLPTVDVS